MFWNLIEFLSPSGDLGIGLVWDNWTGPDRTGSDRTGPPHFGLTLRQISSSAPSHQLSHNLKKAERVLTRVSSLGASLLVGNKADLVKMRRVKQGGGIFLTYCTGLEVNKVLQHFVSWANSSTPSILRHHQVSIVFSAIGFCNLHWYRQIQSKHLKGQLDPPVGDEKYVLVTKNDHFLKGPVFVT